MKTEPAILLAAITAVAVAILAALVSFGMPISDAQQTALLTLLAAVAPVVLGIVTRGAVFAPANVVAAVADGETVAGPGLRTVSDGAPVTVTPALSG